MKLSTITRRKELLATVAWAIRLALRDLEAKEKDLRGPKIIGWKSGKTKAQLDELGRKNIKRK